MMKLLLQRGPPLRASRRIVQERGLHGFVLVASRCKKTYQTVTWIGTGILGSTALLSMSLSSSAQCRGESVVLKADGLFEANEYGALRAMLREALAQQGDDAELLWRLGRACKKLADSEKPKSDAKKALIREAMKATERALELAPSCGPSHKWYAIVLTELGQFEGTTATIKNSFTVREHFERAVKLSPEDATSRHLLGLWCFEVAKVCSKHAA